MSGTLASALRDELIELLSPLAAAADPASYLRMLASLGHTPSLAGNAGLQGALAQVAGALTQLEQLDPATLDSWQGAAQALKVAESAVDALRAAEHALSDPALAAQAEALGLQIANRLVSTYLRRRHPRLHRLAAILTLIDPIEILAPAPLQLTNGAVTRTPWGDDEFHFERLDGLMTDPWKALETAYFPNALATALDAHRAAAILFPLITQAAEALGLRVMQDYRALDPPPDPAPISDDVDALDHFQAPDDEDAPPDPVPLPDDATGVFLLRNLPRLLLLLPGADGAGRLGISITASASEQEGGVAGLTFGAAGSFAWSETRGGWALEAATSGDLPVFVVGPGGLRLADPSGAGLGAAGHVSAGLSRGAQPAFQLGDPNGSRIEIGDLKAQIDFTLTPAQQRIGVTAKAENARLVVAAQGDGLLSEVLPAGGAQLGCDLAITLWSDGGLDIGISVQGSPLSGATPVGKSLGPLLIQAITRDFRTVDTDIGSGLTLAVGVNLAFTFGPITAALVGPSVAVDALWSLKDPNQSKNLGVLHLDGLGLRPPTGVALAIDAAGIVSGGGALLHDAANHLYAGELQLTLQDHITVTAFGLITTANPDGSSGFSLMVLITATGFQPIQLGMGFNLQSIGGLIAVHRTFDQDVLRADLKTDTLSTLLFPRNPAANAAAIVQALSTVFPVKRGSYLLGLLARICWPTPTLVQMDLALVLEIGDQRRLLVLGRISSLLPSRDNDLVRLNLDAMGVLDFDQGTVSIDAVLVDSRLAHKFTLSGAMALRARLTQGAGPAFIMSIGGFNPHFSPPQGLPDLPRISIALSSGDNPRLTCDAYFAITANTVQFGARAQLYAAAYGFSVEGDIGYDVLIQISPLAFIVDFHASVQLKHGSDNLFKVSVDGELAGPRPLQISGKASFEIFWCDFSISFNKTLVDGPPPPPPPPIDLMQQLQAALAAPSSWSNETPAGSHGVALRAVAAGGGLLLDPSGRLVVRQLVVPLDTGRDIDLFGGSPVTGVRRFSLVASLAGAEQAGETVQDQFAPAQFFAMTDDEKLAAPSFESMAAGLAFGDAIGFDAHEIAPAPLAYDTIVIDDLAPPPQPEAPRYGLTLQLLQTLAPSGAAGRAATRRVGRSRFGNDGAPKAVAVQPLTWVVTPLADGAPAAADPKAKTWTELRGVLAQLNAGGARWQMAPAHELAA